MKNVIYEELVQDIRNIAATRDLSSGDITVLSDASWLIESLKSRLESLEKDAARLDWMIDEQVFMEYGGCRYWLVFPDGSEQKNSHQSAREAIDTAMQANKGE